MEVLNQTLYLSLLLISSLISDILGYEVCYSTTNYEYYCEDGYYCCENDTKCCKGNPGTSLSAGAIAGIVGGVFFFVICCLCVSRVCVKKKQQQQQIVEPVQQPGVAVVAAGQLRQPNYDLPVYGMPSYGQQQYGFQQPESDNKAESNNPAFPPPQVYYPPTEKK
ncbi:uncharacterized protein LOC128546008 [Mercenaria mercenaria]|uniref:uncharacterized protein LOC128546008 n=1 Tax=Mercenaria mercenaria TaxID=6596 RepID=UPI00234FB522|nr:uncharacterized protein LOC128546008 [Mercenaria mercenaria]